MKKIGVMAGQFFSMGGVGIIAIQQVRQLRRLGYQAELILLRRTKSSFKEYLSDIPVRYISDEMSFIEQFSFRFPFFSFFSLLYLTYPFYIHRYIKKGEYSLIICHETYTCFTAIAIKKRVGIPYVAFVYDPISYILPRVYKKRAVGLLLPFLSPLGRFLDRKIIENAVETVCCSGLHLPWLEKSFPGKKYGVIYPGCDPLEKIPERRGEFILSLSKWDIGKNPYFLLDVLYRVKNKETRLIVAGNWIQDFLKEDFLNRAREFGLAERVSLTGLIDDATKMRLFSEARVLIHPIVEAFGVFGLEAAACGCPTIIPKGSGVCEIFEDGVSGYFPFEGDIDVFVSKTDELLAGERKAWEIGQRAWEVSRGYTWKNHVLRLIEVINKV